MTTALNQLTEDYLSATNSHDAVKFMSLFAPDAVVEDAGRTITGLAAIQEWSDREIFAAAVNLESLGVRATEKSAVVTTKVDGNFDRTGLPDPLLIAHTIEAEDGKIVRLTCRLAEAPVGSQAD